MKIKQGLALLFSLFISSSIAATSRWSGDWFEVEVILLANISDKSTLKEVFVGDQSLPKYQQHLDILNTYLNPNIAALKQQLPVCEQPSTGTFDTHSIEPRLFPLSTFEQSFNETIEKLQQEIEQEKRLKAQAKKAAETELSASLGELEQSKEKLSPDVDNSGTINNEDDFFDRVKTIEEGAQESDLSGEETVELTDTNGASDNVNNSDNNKKNGDSFERESTSEPLNDLKENTTEAIEKRRLLISEAEREFSPYKNIEQSFPSLSLDPLCSITKQQFEALNTNPKLYSYLGQGIDYIPTIVSANEDLFSNETYIISKESLQLSDIYTQLKRSRNFKPLLHLGWRQQVYVEKNSKPVRLYAGNNLSRDYQKKLQQYEEEKSAALAAEQTLANVLNNAVNASGDFTQQLSPAQQKQLAKQERIVQLSNILASFNSEQSIEALIEPAQQLLHSTQTRMEKAPHLPLQPWYLDGFLNVYLIGNFLNVKADFSMLNMTLAQQESLRLTPNASFELTKVHLKQKRRMISQETHYFDHPYMGVIVQIRRHKRPELEEIESPIE